MLATLTSKGQVTVPKEIREALKLDAGAKLDFVLQPDGSLTIRPLKNSVSSLLGILKRPSGSPTYTRDEERASLGRALVEDDDRIRREAASPAASEPKKSAR